MIRLTAPTSFYVDPLGTDDDEHGSAPGACAFRTPGYGVQFICRNVNAAGFKLKLKVAPATYSARAPGETQGGIVLGDVVGVAVGGWPAHPLIIEGDPLDPAAGPLLSISGAPAVVGVGVNTTWEISGFQIQSTQCDIEADFGTKIYVGHNIHGSVASPYPSPHKLVAVYGGKIEIVAPIKILAGGQTVLNASKNGMIIGASSISVENTPNFDCFAHCEMNSLIASGPISGAATGKRYCALQSSGILSNGAVFPGNAAGGVDATSWYQ